MLTARLQHESRLRVHGVSRRFTPLAKLAPQDYQLAYDVL